MTNEEARFPLYARVTILLIGIIAFLSILYIGKSIIVPIVFAIIIAIMLNPLVQFFIRLKFNRVLSIAIVLVLTFALILGFIFLIFSQANRISDSWPSLVEKFSGIFTSTINDGAEYFDKDPEKINAWFAKTRADLVSKSTEAIGQTLVIVGSALVVLFLLPVYIFLFLFYEPLLIEFIHRLFGSDNKSKIKEIVSQIKSVIQRYLFGIMIEAVLIAALDTTALLILGIQYALLLGVAGALLNMIPYLGGLVAVALPMVVALATEKPVYALYVLIAYYIIQLFDNNFIVPYIVASKVKINALFSIIVVIAGNALWGIPGMFLSIPLLAIVKLVCDHIEPLKPWGFLLGDTMPHIMKMDSIMKIIRVKPKPRG